MGKSWLNAFARRKQLWGTNTSHQDFFNLIRVYQLGDVASLVGLAITVVGFGLALWRIRKSETASQQARRAAESVREQLLQMNAIQVLNDAIRSLEDIRRLHRLKAWSVLPDRYTALKRELIGVRGRAPGLSDNQRSTIQGAIQQVTNIEREVERAIDGNDTPAVQLLNEVISNQIDRLAVLLVELQNEIDRVRQ